MSESAAPSEVRVEAHVTGAEFARALVRARRWLWLALAPAALAWLGLGATYVTRPGWASTGALLLGMSVLVLAFPLLSARLAARRVTDGVRTYVFRDDGFAAQTPMLTLGGPWSAITELREDDAGFLLVVRRRFAVFVPRAAVAPQDLERLRALFATHVRNRVNAGLVVMIAAIYGLVVTQLWALFPAR